LNGNLHKYLPKSREIGRFVVAMTRYIENIDILLSISTRIVSLKKYQFLKNILILKNIAMYHDLFDNVVIFSTDFLLRNCVTEKRLQMGEVNGVKISQS